jgi:hypothetical protein
MALRGVGPRTFVSYSFRDKQTASALSRHLTDAGFDVRMEDETSLLNERLPDVLARRIEDAECFVQLRTESANRSHWVGRELELAEEKRKRDPGFTIVLVVLHKESLDERAQQWVYIDASAGLTDDVQTLVTATGLRSIRPVRVEKSRPVQLVSADVDGLLHGEDWRRVILDADGYWLAQMDQLLAWAALNPEKEGRRAFIAQEEDRRRRLPWSLARADAAGRILARKLRECVELGVIDRATAKLPFEVLYRLVFENLFWPIAQQAIGAGLLADADDFAALSRFGDASTLKTEARNFAWALLPALDERKHLAFTGSHDVIKTGMQSRGNKHSAYVYFPRSALDDDWMHFRDPQSLILQRDWLMFGMPQVAARAIGLTRRHNPETAKEAFEEIDVGMGWALADYRDIGLP